MIIGMILVPVISTLDTEKNSHSELIFEKIQ